MFDGVGDGFLGDPIEIGRHARIGDGQRVVALHRTEHSMPVRRRDFARQFVQRRLGNESVLLHMATGFRPRARSAPPPACTRGRCRRFRPLDFRRGPSPLLAQLIAERFGETRGAPEALAKAIVQILAKPDFLPLADRQNLPFRLSAQADIPRHDEHGRVPFVDEIARRHLDLDPRAVRAAAVSPPPERLLARGGDLESASAMHFLTVNRSHEVDEFVSDEVGGILDSAIRQRGAIGENDFPVDEDKDAVGRKFDHVAVTVFAFLQRLAARPAARRCR